MFFEMWTGQGYVKGVRYVLVSAIENIDEVRQREVIICV